MLSSHVSSVGFNDIVYNNDALIMNRTEELANNGIRFNFFYAQPKCSPSRAALLTGRYPIHTGFNVSCSDQVCF